MPKGAKAELVRWHKQRLTVTGTISKVRPLRSSSGATRYGVTAYCIICDDRKPVSHLWIDLPDRLALGERITVSGIVSKYKRERTGTTSYGINEDVRLELRHAEGGN